MKLILTRIRTEGNCTLGSLELSGPVYKIFPTLEPSPPVLPAGTYPIKLEYSPKFQRYLWELKDIPGHAEIKIHHGNTRKDTQGCILIGMRHGYIAEAPAVLNSRFALVEFHMHMEPFRSIQVKIEVLNDEALSA